MNIIGPGEDWTVEDIYDINSEIEAIADDMGYSTYPNQIEIITSEQMMDAYSSIGLPMMYNHWSFGKSFLVNKKRYDSGQQGLAYEIVINTDPCIVYIMESNTKLMQTLVIAHAGIGHNHFFKNNQLFRQWTKADNIIDYMEFAKNYVTKCEEKYGIGKVEEIINAAHSLMNQSVFRYPRKGKISYKKEMERKIFRALEDEQNYNPIMDKTMEFLGPKTETQEEKRQEKMHLPEENILYFLEKHSPILKPWQREILRIVRNVAQYFYPQGQTQVMNEGCATWTHYTILNKMYDKGLISDGAMIEFIKSHSGVVFQPDFDSPYYSKINPYALGFNMMNDIVRICDKPTIEDREWFPQIAGCKDSFNVLKEAWTNYRDESFIRQFLSPKVMRDMKLFSISNEPKNMAAYEVSSISNENGYRNLRTTLADEHDVSFTTPEIEVVDANMQGDRELHLRFKSSDGATLATKDTKLVLANIATLWGYNVKLTSYTPDGGIDDVMRYYSTSESGESENTTDFGDTGW